MAHVTSSPHHLQSNRKVRNAIKTYKSLLTKSKAARSDICLVLPEWRNTSPEGLQSSQYIGRSGAELNSNTDTNHQRATKA